MLIDRGSRPLWGASAASLLAALALAVPAAAQASTLPTLTLAVTKTSITVGGSTESGAVNIATTASGVKEAGAFLFYVKPGFTVAEVEAVIKAGAGKDPNRADKYGAIVVSTEALVGKTNEVQAYLQPGQYVALGAFGEGGPKVKEAFTVTAAASPAALPTPQATVRSIDFGFTGPTTLHDGELVRFENAGFLVHMDIAFPAKGKSAAKRLAKDLFTGQEKGIEKLVTGEPITFAGPLSSEAFQQETITAKPGWYVQACFMNTQNGIDHTRLGMERVFRIIK